MFIFHNASKHHIVCFRAATVHCSFPNCHHFSEQRKCFALNRKSRSGTGTHLSEQRRFSSAHGRRAAHVPKLWYQHFRLLTSSAFVVLAAFRLICRCYAASSEASLAEEACDHLVCIQSGVSSHMPLLVSKLRSVTVAEDHMITSSASARPAAHRLLIGHLLVPSLLLGCPSRFPCHI
jgi:hypothetical protein